MFNQVPLFDPKSAQYVLGCIMHQPNLLYDSDKYILTVDDFNHKIYNIIFSTIYNLSFNGAEKITPPNIDLYLSGYSTQYDIYNNSNGNDLVQLIYEMAADFDISQFDWHYNRVKKFSTLRELQSKGIDIKDFYNPDFLNQEQEDEKFNKITINDILNKIRNKIQLIENHNVSKQESNGQYASRGIRDLVQSLKENPEIGIPLEGAIFNYATRGCRKGKMYIYSAPSGGGKALPNNTIIPLYNGEFKSVGDIKPGDILIDRLGKPTKVLQIFPQGKKEVYKITFKSGREALCNDEHLWSYRKETQRKDSPLKTSTLREIINEGVKNNYKNTDGGFNYLVPINLPVQYKERSYKISPYVFGLILGGGSFRQQPSNKSFQFSSQDKELVDSIAFDLDANTMKSSDKNYTWYFSKNGKNIYVEDILNIYPELINAYSQDKFIPQEYLFGSEQQRWDLLAGLMDTDGSIDNKGRCSFSTISKKLADNIVFLCQTLGVRTTIREDRRSDKYTTGVCYDITIQSRPLDKLKMFKLSRKYNIAKTYLETHKRFENNEYDAIVDIQCLNYEIEMTCFLVDNKEHLFLMNDFIVTHNTRTMVGNACSIAFPRIENGKIVQREVLEPVLFIATEMNADEIQTLILSWISGVNEEKLLLNQLTEDEMKLINIAINIMEKYEKNFIIESVPNPSIQSLKSMMTNYIIHDNVEYIFYDYIFSSVGLMQEFRDVGLREDVVLMMLSNTLKEVAAEYNVFVMTGTQLNGDWSKTVIRNANMLRGSKAIADKTDMGVIGVRVTDDELEPVKAYCEEMHLPLPNIVLDIYKNRRGKLCDVKIFRKFDYGTCRVKDICVTTQQYKFINEVPEISYNVSYEDIKKYE